MFNSKLRLRVRTLEKSKDSLVDIITQNNKFKFIEEKKSQTPFRWFAVTLFSQIVLLEDVWSQMPSSLSTILLPETTL